MSLPPLSYDECRQKAEDARAKAAAATGFDAQREYQEIASLWDELCEKMRKNGLMHMPAPR